MAPDPNSPKENKMMDLESTMVVNNMPLQLDEEDDEMGGGGGGGGNMSSGDESDNDVDYNAYKPLAQDDIPNGHHTHDSDSEEDSDDDDSGCENDANPVDEMNFADFTDMETITMSDPTPPVEIRGGGGVGGINYDDLHCEGVDEELVPSSSIQYGAPTTAEEEEEEEEGAVVGEHIDMNETQAELVRNAMSGFSLPPMNIPEWARDISDDQWKDTLVTAIQKKPGT